MTVPTILAARSARRREEEQATLDAFRVADATAGERAQRLDRLPGASSEALTRLVDAGVIRAVGRGRYYLDETAVVARRDVDAPTVVPRGLILIVGLAVVAGLAVFG